MNVKLILHTPQEHIGEMSKICYATKSLEAGGKDITTTIIHQHKHLAALRFAYATISVEEISVACQNQIVRSKHLDFMVQSKRYVNADKGEFKFIYPIDMPGTSSEAMRVHWDTSIALYQRLLADGVKKEDARAILPANISTKMNITGNLQAWWSFFVLRLNPHAQTEIRDLAKTIYITLATAFPLVFTDKLFDKLSKG